MAFSADIASRAEEVLAAARGRGMRLACAESCTGGLVAAALTEIPGSADTFAGGVVSYMLDVKEHVLGVPGTILYDPSIGAVSPECARAMADGVAELLSADVAVSVTGIAGPGGEEPGKPVGTVWFGLRTPGGTTAHVQCFPGTRSDVREQALVHALDLLYGVCA